MLNFKTWLEVVDIETPSLEKAIQSFFVPDDTIYITAASIIDGELTNRHFPFIYLQQEDKIFVGEKNQYHPEIIDAVPDANIRSKLNSVYNMQPSPSGAVGRIGFQLKFPKLTRRLPESNLKKLYYNSLQQKFNKNVFDSFPSKEQLVKMIEDGYINLIYNPNIKIDDTTLLEEVFDILWKFDDDTQNYIIKNINRELNQNEKIAYERAVN